MRMGVWLEPAATRGAGLHRVEVCLARPDADQNTLQCGVRLRRSCGLLRPPRLFGDPMGCCDTIASGDPVGSDGSTDPTGSHGSMGSGHSRTSIADLVRLLSPANTRDRLQSAATRVC